MCASAPPSTPIGVAAANFLTFFNPSLFGTGLIPVTFFMFLPAFWDHFLNALNTISLYDECLFSGDRYFFLRFLLESGAGNLLSNSIRRFWILRPNPVPLSGGVLKGSPMLIVLIVIIV